MKKSLKVPKNSSWIRYLSVGIESVRELLEWVNSHLIHIIIGAIAIMVIAPIISIIKKMRSRVLISGLAIGITTRGIVLGLSRLGLTVYSPVRKESHIAVFGGSGSGKTSAVLIPTLKNWRGHFFTIDIAGDIAKNMENEGDVVFAPFTSDKVAYDPLYCIDVLNDRNMQNDALINLAYMLIPETAKDDAGRWYEESGRAILKAALITYYHKGMDFVDICDMIIRSDTRNLIDSIQQYDDGEATKYISALSTMNEKSLSGCKQKADAAIELFTIPRLKRVIKRARMGEITITPKSIESANVVFSIPDNMLEQYAPFVELIVHQLLDYLAVRPAKRKQKLLIAIDEYASFPNLNLTASLQKLRKRNCRIMILLQSLAQLDRNFGIDVRREMMDNFDINVICSACDPDTQQYFSEKAGNKFVRNEIRDSTGRVINVSETEKKNIKPENFAKLHDDLIVISKGETYRLKKKYY